jgi:hypothetical protein
VIQDFDKLLDRVSSPTDLAAILIAGPLAYVLDAGLDVVGFLPPGYVAITASSVVLGLKKAIEAQFGRRGVLRRATALSELLSASDAPEPLREQLASELRLYRGRITTRTQLAEALDDCLTQYRAWQTQPRPSRKAPQVEYD